MILDSACPPYTFIPCHSHTIVLENSGLKKGLTYPYLMYLISFDCIQLVSLFTCQILPTCLIFLNILEPCVAAGHNPSISLYKMGTRVKRAPKSYPKKSLYKMGTWVDLATCQKHQKVLRISQKKTFYRGIKWWVIRVPGYLYFIEEIARGILYIYIYTYDWGLLK